MPLKNIKGGLWVPSSDIRDTTSSNALTVDAAGEKAAFIIQAPETGTISKVWWSVRALTTGDDVDVRIETVDSANGDPSGTLWATNTNGTQTVSATGAQLTTLTAGASVTKGDEIAVVIANGAGPGDFQVDCGGSVPGFPYCDLFTASWTKLTRFPFVGLEYSDGSYHSSPLVTPSSGVPTTLFSSSSTPDHIGLRFRFPFPFRITGWWGIVDLDGDADVKLYDEDGATVLATDSLDANIRGSTGGSLKSRLFSSDYELKADTSYRVVFAPSTTTNIRVYYKTVDADGLSDAYSGGQDFHRTTAKDPTSESGWTNTVTEKPLMGVIIDALHDGQTSRWF